MEESDFITGTEYDELFTEYENETRKTRSKKRNCQSTPRPPKTVRRNRNKRSKITSVPTIDKQITGFKNNNATRRPCDSKFKINISEITHWKTAIISVLGLEYDIQERPLQNASQLVLTSKNTNEKYVSINFYTNGTVMIQGLNNCSQFIDNHYEKIKQYVRNNMAREITPDNSEEDFLDETVVHETEAKLIVNTEHNISSRTETDLNISPIPKSKPTSTFAALNLANETTPKEVFSTPSNWFSKQRILDKARSTRKKSNEALISSCETNKILENEIVNIKAEINTIHDTVKHFSVDLQRELKLAIQPFYEILRRVEDKVFQASDETKKLKENLSTSTKITHEISTQTDDLFNESSTPVSKCIETKNETYQQVLSRGTRKNRYLALTNDQGSISTKDSTQVVNLVNNEHYVYNVEVDNRFSALDQQQTKDHQEMSSKVSKYSTVRKPTEKFQHLIIGSSITKLIDSKYLNKRSNFFTCVRTLSGAHYIDIHNYLKDIQVHRDTSHVTVVAGANDCCSPKSVEAIQLELDKLIKLLQSKFPNAKIQFVEPIKRRGTLGERFNKTIQIMCDHLAKIAKIENISVLFINDKLQGRQELYADLVHLSQHGTAILMGEIKRFWNTGWRRNVNRSYKFEQRSFNYSPSYYSMSRRHDPLPYWS